MKTGFQKNLEEWAAKNSAEGLSGSAKIVVQTDEGVKGELNIAVGEQSENATKIPPELLPYLKEILAERDKLAEQYAAIHTGLATANDKAAATLAAIEIIRERHKERYNEQPNTGC